MRFEYNEDLEKEDRINLVMDEIKSHYEDVDIYSAYMAALLSSPVDDKPTNDEKFERYYHLLRCLNPKNYSYLHIFNDLYNVYEAGIKKTEYNDCVREIIKYITGERNSFPVISDFYN